MSANEIERIQKELKIMKKALQEEEESKNIFL